MLLELGRDFEAIGAATRATSMCPDYAPAFLTLARWGPYTGGRALGCWIKDCLSVAFQEWMHVVVPRSLLQWLLPVLLQPGPETESSTQRAPRSHLPALLSPYPRAQLNYGEPKLALASYEAVLKLQPDHAEALEEIKDAQMKAIMHARMPGGRRAQVRVAGVPG